MKKNIIYLSLITLLSSSNVIAETLNDQLCKTNVLHYAVAISDLNYVSDLTKNHVFNLTDYNKNCETAFHIAVRVGSEEILSHLYNIIQTYDIKNKSGENLLQTAIDSKQYKILIFLLNKGLDPDIKSTNGLNSFEYQEKHGDIVSENILNQYLLNREFNKKDKDNKLYITELNILKNELTLNQEKLSELVEKNPENQEQILFYRNTINSLELQIKNLEKIISNLEKEIENLKNQLKGSVFTTETSNVMVETIDKIEFEENTIIDNKKENKSNTNSENKDKNIDKLPEITNNGDIISDSFKLFEILSKPIYKVD